MTSVGPEDGLQEMPPRCSRTALVAVGLVQPHSRDLGTATSRNSFGVAVLGQPADVSQASQRPPCVDEVAVDVGAVAGDDVAEGGLLVPEREDGEVKDRVALGRC